MICAPRTIYVDGLSGTIIVGTCLYLMNLPWPQHQVTYWSIIMDTLKIGFNIMLAIPHLHLLLELLCGWNQFKLSACVFHSSFSLEYSEIAMHFNCGCHENSSCTYHHDTCICHFANNNAHKFQKWYASLYSILLFRCSDLICLSGFFVQAL
mgnify:FL=1